MMFKQVDAKLVKVPGGYRLNGFPLVDALQTPEGRAMVKSSAKDLADRIVADALKYALEKVDAKRVEESTETHGSR